MRVQTLKYEWLIKRGAIYVHSKEVGECEGDINSQ